MNKPVREGFVLPDQPRGGAPAAAPEPAASSVEQESPAPAYVETWPVKVKLLHRPVTNYKNEELHELSFREPTGADINRHGNPCRITADFEVVIDEKKMTMMISALSGVLPPNLERMDPRDWNSCAYRLRRFFLPEAEAW